MNTDTSAHSCRPNAFALAELLVAVAIAALLALAVSLAVVGAGRRTSAAADELLDARHARESLHATIGEIRWANRIVTLDTDSITFTLTDDSGTASTPDICYYYDDSEYELRRSCDGEDRLLLARVYGVTFTPGSSFTDDEGDIFLRTLTVTIQYAPEPEATREITLNLANCPLW